MFGFNALADAISWVLTPAWSFFKSDDSKRPDVAQTFAAEIHGRTLLAFQLPGAEPFD